MTSAGAERRLVSGNRGRAQSLRHTKTAKGQLADQPGGQAKSGQLGSVAQTQTVGNLTAEPELRYTATGTAITRFTVASNKREFDPMVGQWRDTTTFTLCIVRGAQAEHAAELLRRGHRVFVVGQVRYRSSSLAGRKGSTLEINVDEIALSLRNEGAEVGRT